MELIKKPKNGKILMKEVPLGTVLFDREEEKRIGANVSV